MPDTFTPNSLTHALAVGLSILAILGLVWVGRAALRRSEQRERRIRVAWIWFVILLQGFGQIWQNLPAQLDLKVTLPLQICDLAPWMGVLALATKNPWARALTYYWGAGLSVWAFVLPDLDAGPASATFWVFWIGHIQIVACAMYLVFVLGHRPCWSDLRRAALALAAYTAILMAIDVWLEADYGYVGPDSIAEPLGPWPARVGVLFVAELAIFGLLLLPWTLARRHAVQP